MFQLGYESDGICGNARHVGFGSITKTLEAVLTVNYEVKVNGSKLS